MEINMETKFSQVTKQKKNNDYDATLFENKIMALH